MVEPWLRGTLTELDPLPRGVIHALWLASEDVARWCKGLSGEELMARPFELPSVAFQMRHIVRSLDRLLTYTEGQQLNLLQMHALATEAAETPKDVLFNEFEQGMALAEDRVKKLSSANFNLEREVGRNRLPATIGGLLVHCADHTQRHAGQTVTTAQVIMGRRPRAEAVSPAR